MQESIEKIEKDLEISLPNDYKKNLVNFPFPKGSYASDLFANDVDFILEVNKMDWSHVDFGSIKPFFIGTDGGEETYFINTLDNKSPVYSYSIETNKYSKIYDSVNDFIIEIKKDPSNLKIIYNKNKRRETRIDEKIAGYSFIALIVFMILYNIYNFIFGN